MNIDKQAANSNATTIKRDFQEYSKLFRNMTMSIVISYSNNKPFELTTFKKVKSVEFIQKLEKRIFQKLRLNYVCSVTENFLNQVSA
ncbi:CLUMA_CG008785, isoform A [Clunio marinus]|uniref:CLUMA_CG008785, isoform A n=1 Tax=Clunio marinus TaxID=568069 RepID=A0A1J1I4H6_9DIPT|nr:CLUMA_CG008785, isoform A [Clunio marinus]